jgi:hypothetical protein
LRDLTRTKYLLLRSIKNATYLSFSLADFTHQWPPCVSVESITLEAGASLTLMENCIRLPSSVRELQIVDLDLQTVYAALQKLGPELTKLQLNYFHQGPTPIDMYKVLAACPRLENFNFLFGNMTVLPNFMSESALLPSEYFQNFKRLFFGLLHTISQTHYDCY